MTITSPRDALQSILDYCNMPPSPLAAPMTPAHMQMRDTIQIVAKAGVERYDSKPRLTPAMYAADRLLEAALAYEECLTEQFVTRTGSRQPQDYAHENPLAAELVELRTLLAPLRPPTPLNPAIEALLVQARAEQMIGEDDAEALRALARRLAK